MANITKGPAMEEALRTYFSQAGYFAVRGVPFIYQGFDVTDIDCWIYSRSSPVSREITIVDIKNKKTPQAIERIFWTSGLQKAIGADRAIVATSDRRPEVKEFGRKLNILVLDGAFISKLETKGKWIDERLSDEEFAQLIASNPLGKIDGDWKGRIQYCKSLLAKGLSFDICNDLMSNARFFAEMAIGRMEHSKTALRCFYFTCALIAICIDYLMRDISFVEAKDRAVLLNEGFSYGSRGREGFSKIVDISIGLVTQYAPGGRAIANQVRANVADSIANLPSSILGDFFSRREVLGTLFSAAKELEGLAMNRDFISHTSASTGSRAIIGCFLDFWGIDRTHLSLPAAEQDGQPSVLNAEINMK